MPMQWSSLDHERMLMICLDLYPNIKMRDVVAAWPANYPNTEAPTLRAAEQHVTKLRKQVGGGSPAPKKSMTVTPKKTAARPIKTPTSTPSKRKAAAMSDEDDTEVEVDLKVIKMEHRSSLARRSKSKSLPPSAVLADSEAEDEDGGKENAGRRATVETEDQSEVSDFAA